MANIHSFESMATLDGEGIRYGVFFTGCPLRCVYCHNPDTWFKGNKEYTAEQLVNKIKRYKPYFKNGGGVTFSGGEPLLNAAFINEVCPLLNAEGISYCLDTSGSVPLTEEVKECIKNADMVILDIKFCDEESYKKYTGGVFENFIAIGKYCSEIGKKLWLRTVVVPDINDSEEQIKKYAEFAKQFKYEKYELLAFHTMGFFKYENLNIENPLLNTKPLSKERLNELQKIVDNA
ncbi:MAG: pyruvate formate lyase-activating protein [Eubacterium sp.]|nr:pyruvate formate lyase-activating protein [Eubacterium sp.]